MISQNVNITWFMLVTLLALTAAAGRDMNNQQLRTIQKYMDATVEPCEDFYNHSCGRWEQIHDDADYYDTIGFVDFKVNHEYGRILKKLRRRNDLLNYKFVRNVLDFFKSCNSMSDYVPSEYLNWLEEHENIVWPPALPSRSKRPRKQKNYDWLRTLAVLRRYGMNSILLEETVLPKRGNSRVFLIDVDKPVANGGFQPMDYKGFQLMLQYLLVDDESRIESLWEEIHGFEEKLKKLDDIEDDTDGLMEYRLSELQMPLIERYLSIILDDPVDPDMLITIQNLPYMRVLITLLRTYGPEFKCRYLMIRFLWHLNIDGPRSFFKRDCVAHTRGSLSMAMSWLYEQYNPELVAQKDDVEKLFRNLLQHFRDRINVNGNRFDYPIQQFLLAKVDSMQIKVGNLPRPNTAERLEQFYQHLMINSSDFYANHLRVSRFAVRAQHKRLYGMLPQNDAFFYLEDFDTGVSSSPYYLLRLNVVIVPLTLLHAPIYHADLHDIFKYSSLGFLLAHEITHGFDDTGVEFDQEGNMRGPSVKIKSNDIFDENLSCLRGKNPQIIDEKIADISGFRWAYESYFKRVNGSLIDPTLDWDLPPERLFFHNFALFFCGSSGASAEFQESSEHGTDRQRVIDTLGHFSDFGRIYKCPTGARMNPRRKCQLWR